MSVIWEKYKNVIPYLLFGICTTAVNILIFAICNQFLAMDVMPSTLLAWFLAVLFAYVTNRKWVFYSDAVGKAEIIKETIAFFGCRLATGVCDWLMMYVFVQLLQFNGIVIKILANIIVIILNYVASRLVVFRRRQ